MTLPKLNDVPKYDLVIPSTKQKVKYRPFLVKEEKVLMLAMESKDTHKTLQAVADTIEACVVDQIDINKLATFDVEYMFTQIRSKSVGETAKLGLKCSNCDTSNEISIDISSIEVDTPEVDDIIKLNNDISLKMKWPSYIEATDPDLLNETSETTQTFKLMIKCIESVMTESENLLMSDQSMQEALDFVESLSSQQFKLIKDYVEKMPAMRHTINFECVNCNNPNEIRLQGMNDFF